MPLPVWWVRLSRTGLARIGAGALVVVTLGLVAALLSPGTATFETPVRVEVVQTVSGSGLDFTGSGRSEFGASVAGMSRPAQPPPDDEAVSSCGIFDVSACISEAVTGLLRAAVADIVNPALELLSDTLLQTPRPSAIPRLAELWQVSWQLTVAVYGIVILVGALIVMAHQSVQTQFGLREIGPRLVVGFVAGWLTLPLADMAVQIANAVSDALLGPVDDGAGMRGLAVFVSASLTGPGPGFGSAWMVLAFGLMVGVGLIALLCGYVLRVIALLVLVAAAPLIVMWHALPQTDGVARWWWRALAGLLSIQIIQALVLAVGVQLLLPPPGDQDGAAAVLIGLPGSGWVTLLVLGALLWVLVKIPGWVWFQIGVGGGRRSLLGSAVRAAVLFKTAGFLRGALTTRTTGRSSGAARSAGSSRGRGEQDEDPYAHPPVFAGGQLGLPMPGMRRRRPAPVPSMPPRPARLGARAQDGVQLALPLGQDWPENRPVADRDGQLRLPIETPRVPRPARPRGGFTPPTPTAPSSRPGRRHLRFPASGQWPENQPVLGRDGQYRLPITTLRRRPPTTPPPAPSAPPVPASPVAAARRAAAARARQLSFDDLARDLDPFRGNRALAGGQYPLPLPGLTRRPRPPDRARTAPTPPPAPPSGRAARPAPGQTRLPIPAPPRPARPAAPSRPAAPTRPRPATPPPPAPPPASAQRRPRRSGPSGAPRPGTENTR